MEAGHGSGADNGQISQESATPTGSQERQVCVRHARYQFLSDLLATG